MANFSSDQRKILIQKNQAMPDGGFPIRNENDLKNAIQSYGRANNKPAVKEWIKKRAKELDLEKDLPDDWKDNSISHHGIMGMHWGAHRVTQKSLTSAKEGIDSASNIVKSVSSIHSSIKKSGSAKKRDLSYMTDQELRERVNRMSLEKQYSSLNQGIINEGKSRAEKILDVAGNTLAIGSSALGIALAIKKLKG